MVWFVKIRKILAKNPKDRAMSERYQSKSLSRSERGLSRSHTVALGVCMSLRIRLLTSDLHAVYHVLFLEDVAHTANSVDEPWFALRLQLGAQVANVDFHDIRGAFKIHPPP